MLDKILGWKLWAIVGSILTVVFYGLKLRGDHYQHKAEDAEDALLGAEAEGSTMAYEAAEAARRAATERDLKRIKEEASHATDDPDAITTAID